MEILSFRALLVCVAAGSSVAATADPQYNIYDIGLLQQTDSASQGFQVSPNGIATGRSLRTGGAQAFTWTLGGGIVGLPNLAGRPYAVGNSVNNSGVVVGTGATTSFGSGRLPLMWQSGSVTQLALLSGQTLGDANGVNLTNVAVGSNGSGTTQFGVIYQNGGVSLIPTGPSGIYFRTAFGINDSGLIIGQGIDPNNAAVNVGIVYDMATNTVSSVGALSGFNGALAFGVSNAGHVVGSSMFNQGSGLPFIWTSGGGIVGIPLVTGASSGIARAVNSSGWVVGIDSSAFALPFLYDGTNSYRLGDLIPQNTGWDLLTNTSSSALGISENGTIIGTGVFNGAIHAYAMVPVPEPTSLAILGIGVLAVFRKLRKSRL